MIASSFLITPRVALRYLVLCVAVCIAAMAVSTFATAWLIRTKVEPRDNLTQNLTQLTTLRAPIVALGDSRMAFDFEPGDDSINIAYVAENILDMARRLDLYLAADGPAPQVVLLQATPHLFSTYRLSVGRAGYLDSAETGIAGIGERHLPYVFRYWKLFLNGKGFDGGTIEVRPRGGLMRTERFDSLTEDGRRVAAAARAAQQLPINDIPAEPSAAVYSGMVNDLIARGIQVCLINLPVSSEYLSAVDDSDRIAAARAFYQRLAEQTGVTWVDLERALPAPSDARYFTDADHLTPEGASILTGRIIDGCPPAADIAAR